MQNKQRMLELLELHKGSPVSGEWIARKLGISRSAVWKAICELRADGHQIEAVTRRGYTLSANSNLLTETGIRCALAHDIDVKVLPQTDSTNLQARRLGGQRTLLVAAEEQTAGKGRIGHSFFSPKGGVYFSLLLHPVLSAADATLLTTAAAVAVCEGVEQLTGKKLGIKWVNDLFLDGKKVGGILTEASTDLESGQIETVVVGVGLNLFDYQFPPELCAAGFITDDRSVSRNQLIGTIAGRLLDYVAELPDPAHLSEYRSRMFLMGKTMRLPDGSPAVITDITDRGQLEVRVQQETRTFNAGEISLRLP